ncbi:hypothetical protein [Streptococcus caprae]|uniref:hypothetical protein n=1 Tax=Streptococcus caprae TaxID=1640501 RepID=UPI0036D41F2A
MAKFILSVLSVIELSQNLKKTVELMPAYFVFSTVNHTAYSRMRSLETRHWDADGTWIRQVENKDKARFI